jgi:2-dehydro-3-deoxygalactonokinase
MQKFLSCDWGTTNFRIRLIDISTSTIISEITTREGIQSTYNEWQLAAKSSEERLTLYQSRIAAAIHELQVSYGHALQNIPIVISGMASSSIGMMELPYKQIPVNLSAFNLEHAVIEATEKFNHTTLLISGIKSNDDVMRGEETKIFGCFQEEERDKHLFIIPGTHPKHVVTEDSNLTSFSTFMTGEMFNLLSTQSILKASVEEETFGNQHATAFVTGVIKGASSNILHSLFTTRTNQLFNRYNKADNYFYLSGLLIGYELKEISDTNFDKIHLVSNKTMKQMYITALEVLLPNQHIQIIDSDQALIMGQLKIAKAFDFI